MIFTTILPIFALILIGFAFARIRRLGDDTVGTLNTYVVWLALPALLFDFVAEADWRTLDQPRFVAVFAFGMFATFAVSMLFTPYVAGDDRPLAQRALDALTASYANTAYMGIPLASGLLGAAGLAAAVIASLLTVCMLFAFTIMLVEIDLHRGGSRLSSLRRAAISVLRNPIALAPIVGGIWALTGLALPAPVSTLCKMLGASATPVALVTIGIFLAQPRGRGEPAELALAVVLKLIVQPVLTIAAFTVIPLARPYAAAALVLAALPTGTGPFMVARLYDREVTLASRAILVSTLLSVATIAGIALWIAG